MDTLLPQPGDQYTVTIHISKETFTQTLRVSSVHDTHICFTLGNSKKIYPMYYRVWFETLSEMVKVETPACICAAGLHKMKPDGTCAGCKLEVR